MASLGAYLLHTNHLSDRELYEYLYHDGLREEAVLFPENPSYAYMIDLTGSGSEEDNQIYLKYYADEEHRRQWAHDWPDDPYRSTRSRRSIAIGSCRSRRWVIKNLRKGAHRLAKAERSPAFVFCCWINVTRRSSCRCLCR